MIMEDQMLSSGQQHEDDSLVRAAEHPEFDKGRAERNVRLTEDAEFPLWNIWTAP
jgi:hypothetical protein